MQTKCILFVHVAIHVLFLHQFIAVGTFAGTICLLDHNGEQVSGREYAPVST